MKFQVILAGTLKGKRDFGLQRGRRSFYAVGSVVTKYGVDRLDFLCLSVSVL